MRYTGGVLTVAMGLLWLPPADATTCIFFAGFYPPLFHDGCVYLSHPATKRLICLDLARDTVRWQHHLKGSGWPLWVSPENELWLRGFPEIQVLDAATGQSLRGWADPQAINPDIEIKTIDRAGRWLYFQAGEPGHLRCVAPETDQVLWDLPLAGRVHNAETSVADDWVFVSWTPWLGKLDGQMNFVQGPSEHVALKTKDGSPIWRVQSGSQHHWTWDEIEKALDEAFPGPTHRRSHVAANATSVAYAIDRELFLIDRTTGEQILHHQSETAVHGLAWWRETGLILCSGDRAAPEKQVTIIRDGNFDQATTFTLPIRRSPSLHLVGDVMILATGESLAFDLENKRRIWASSGRSYLDYRGALYCEENTWHDESGYDARFGRCDPRTGEVTPLYSLRFRGSESNGGVPSDGRSPVPSNP